MNANELESLRAAIPPDKWHQYDWPIWAAICDWCYHVQDEQECFAGVPDAAGDLIHLCSECSHQYYGTEPDRTPRQMRLW